MKIINKTGHNKIKEAEENFKRVKEYFTANRNNSKAECSRDLKLSYPTVLKYASQLEKEGE
jgi:hypothetical protein